MGVYQLVFSPTGGTRAAADLLAEALFTGADVRTVDLTDSRYPFGAQTFTEEDVVLIAVPSYGGRVPKPAVERLAEMRGNGARAVLMCVYGNRAYEDTLVELQDTVQQAGFCAVAGVAALAEHSILRHYAAGRPDAQDRAQLRTFGAQIRDRLASGVRPALHLPGNRPYKTAGGAHLIPQPTEACTRCGLCAERCPVQAIEQDRPQQVDPQRCISCMRCVALCPSQARRVDPVRLAAVDAALKVGCAGRKHGELYL